MPLQNITLKNFTVFEKIDLDLCSGINVFVGSNGKGKTHLMKLLYSACQAADKKVSFSQKIVRCFTPDDYKISRLIQRKQGYNEATVKISGTDINETDTRTITVKFNKKTKKWDAEIIGEEKWELLFQDLTSIFIPAKEILSHSYNLNAAVEMNNVSFDDTYLDVINAAKIDISAGKNPTSKQKLLNQIEKVIDGKVYFDAKKDEFYLKKGNSKLEFNLVAEGIRKIALIWQLAKNGTLENGSVLFWDEPEANVNPEHIPTIVDLLFELQRHGVQVFVATHDYIFAKYVEIRAQQQDQVMFYSFYGEQNQVQCSKSKYFSDLENNAIMNAFDQLLGEVYVDLVSDNE